MAERTVKLGSMFYIDDKGTPRRGQEGDKIQVSSDFVKRFDALNHLAGDATPAAVIAPEAVEAAERDEPEEPKEPKRRAALPAKKADSE